MCAMRMRSCLRPQACRIQWVVVVLAEFERSPGRKSSPWDWRRAFESHDRIGSILWSIASCPVNDAEEDAERKRCLSNQVISEWGLNDVQHFRWEWMQLGYKLQNIFNIQTRFSRKSARLSQGGNWDQLQMVCGRRVDLTALRLLGRSVACTCAASFGPMEGSQALPLSQCAISGRHHWGFLTKHPTISLQHSFRIPVTCEDVTIWDLKSFNIFSLTPSFYIEIESEPLF